MKSIGEFAKNNNVTIRALHHYEKLELIIPCKVDESTGYRYYTDKQSDTLQFILELKKLGFSLNEIKQLLANTGNREMLLRSLRNKKSQALIQKNTAESNYNLLNNILKNYENSADLTFMEILEMSINENEKKKDKMSIFRHIVNDTFDEYKTEGKSLFAMTLDIDNFSDINKHFGYDVGDEVIENVYNSIIQAQSEMNINAVEHYAITERPGGDEFKIILKDNKENASSLAEKIIEYVKTTDYSYLSDELKTSVTIGIAGITSAHNAYELMHNADTAMLDAKNKNKGSYLFF